MSDLIGQRFGQYEIISLLGKGGMATVYRAHQLNIKRDVAIKVIKPELAETGDFVKRFEREAETIASLSHPHILKLFDYGEHSNTVYLVMELLTGGSLADVIRTSPLKLDYSARVFDQIAEALDYAHQQGIIHRDLKPQNVLLDRMGNAFLTDFGIAKLINATMALTQSGLAMGTPAYMPPEQWRGEPVDARSDIYSLGVMLFEMLSGRLPFDGETPFKVMHQHVYEELPPLRNFRPDIPSGVESVLARAMAKDREVRFQSAAQFSQAYKASLTTPLASQAVPTRPRPVDDRTMPESFPAAPPPSRPSVPSPAPTRRASPTPPAPPPADMFGGTVSLPAASQPQPQQQQRRSSPLPVILGALAALIVVGVIAVLVLPRILNPTSNPTPVPSLAVAGGPTFTPTRDATIAAAIAAAATQTQSALAGGTATGGSDTGTSTAVVLPPTTVLTDTTAPTDTTVPPIDTTAPTATTVPPSATPQVVVAAISDTPTTVVVPPTLVPANTTVPPTAAPLTATSVPTDTTVAPTDTPVPPTVVPPTLVPPTVAPPTLVPPTVAVTDTAAPNTPFTVTSVAGDVDAHSYYGPCPKVFTFSAVITTSAAGTVTYRWERSDASSAPTQSLDFGSGGGQTVTTQWSLSRTPYAGWMVLHVLTPNDISTDQISFTLTCDTSAATATLPKLQVNPTLVVDPGKLVTLVAVAPKGQPGANQIKYVGHQGPIYSGVFSPDGKQILTGGFDKTARLWDVASGKQVQQYKGHLNWVSSVAFSPDGKKIITGSWDTTAKVWDVASGKELFTLSGDTQPVMSVAFSPDGKTILTGSSDRTARLWDAGTGKQLRQIDSPSLTPIYGVAFSPDGKLIATSGADSKAQVWDAQSGQMIKEFSGHTAPVFRVVFSPDSKSIATASDDKTAKLWDVASGKLLQTFSGHNDFVRSVAISPDGKMLATGSGDATAKLWDIQSGKVLFTFSRHGAAVVSVNFSPDGAHVVSVSDDGVAFTWDS